MNKLKTLTQKIDSIRRRMEYMRHYMKKRNPEFKITRKNNPSKYKVYDKTYRLNNAEKLRLAQAKRYFGKTKEIIFSVYGEFCQECKITRQEHILEFDEDLSIHHIDGLEKYTPQKMKNNDINNLIPLCRSCHARKHLNKRWNR